MNNENYQSYEEWVQKFEEFLNKPAGIIDSRTGEVLWERPPEQMESDVVITPAD